MNNLLSLPGLGTLPIGVLDVVDIAVTTVLIYYFLLLIRGTRAVQIMVGLFVLIVILAVAKVLHLLLLATLMQYVVIAIAVTLPIVFQPELRRALEQIGRGGFFTNLVSTDEPVRNEETMAILASAATALSQSRTGALIAIEQATGLKEIVESGTALDAVLSLELLLSLFSRSTPLHDGATIVSRGRIVAAACFLPLSESVTDRHLGTRHRAALGLAEQTDAVVLVISEQTGSISIARGGKLSREIADEERLRRVLLACTRPPRARRQATPNLLAKIRQRLPSGTSLTE
ncbi:MAG: TIGR00159 family protein, partial [Candidatus Eremiobacteraeota bacterium]|nr:TIGR00159 family protein [Candidatus Eremiobacteraeota bacterium]